MDVEIDRNVGVRVATGMLVLIIERKLLSEDVLMDLKDEVCMNEIKKLQGEIHG